MRQTILVSLALIAVICGAWIMTARIDDRRAILALMTQSKQRRLYNYKQFTRITEAGETKAQTLLIECRAFFTGRGSYGKEQFLPIYSLQDVVVQKNGVELKNAKANIFEGAPQDIKGRPMLNGRADLYPIAMLNAPEFFPFLPGRATSVGDEWQNQFRVKIPECEAPLVVLLRTRAVEYLQEKRESLVRLSYTGSGQAVSRSSADDGSERFLLEISGESLWNISINAPYSLKHKIALRCQDFDRIRESTVNYDNPNFAVKSIRETRVTMQLMEKGLSTPAAQNSTRTRR